MLDRIGNTENRMSDLFAVSSPGLESFTTRELQKLGLLQREGAPARESASNFRLSGNSDFAEDGGVSFRGGLEAIYRANLHLRTTSRVLVRLGVFYASAFSELRKKASRLPWENYLGAGRPVELRVTCRKSRLYHSEAVAERIAGAIADRLGESPRLSAHEERNDAQLIVARIYHDQCTISMDSSGELLHRRGYRLASAKAPLRETLAAGMLMASGWEAESPLIDPFCGSGTIPIEAALLAGRRAPGFWRRFSFMDWPDFDPLLWRHILADAEAEQQAYPGSGQGWPKISASDRDAGAMRMAQSNAERAGVAERIEFACQAVSSVEAVDGCGWIVTNPPYGKRVSKEKDLRNLYAQIGNVIRLKFPGWRFAILCREPRLFGYSQLPSDYSLPMMNGGTPVRLYCGESPGD